MFNGIDFDSLEDSKFDGASLGSKYIPPPVPEHGGEIEEGMRVYNGNCHCGSVTYTVKSKPLGELKVMSCNCSLCSRVRTNLLPHSSTLSPIPPPTIQPLLTTTAERRSVDIPRVHERASRRRRESNKVYLSLQTVPPLLLQQVRSFDAGESPGGREDANQCTHHEWDRFIDSDSTAL